MEKAVLVALLLVGGCTGTSGLKIIQSEMLLFKADNEELRAADLEKRYLAQKKKADRLSDSLLKITRKRDELYAEYDGVHGETTRLDRDVKSARARNAKLAQDLKKLQAERKKLQAELVAERKATEKLQAELEAARKKRDALEAKKAGGKSPG